LASVLSAIRRQASAAIHGAARALAGPRIGSPSPRAEPLGQAETAAAGGSDLILRVDAAGVVLSVSEGPQEAFALHGEELLGRGFLERVHVGDRPSYLQAVGSALQRDATISVTLKLRTGFHDESGGEPPDFAWIEMRIHRCANAQAKGEAAAVCAVRNLTEAAEAASATGEHHGGGSWKDRLLANVSHELRTPLNAILGFSEILSSPDLAPADNAKQREYAGIIHASAEHLLSVVNLILDISKIEAGRFAIAPERLDVGPLIASCCDMLRLKAHEGGVDLVQAPLDIRREFVADKRCCRQIVINLLSNAVKFTPPDGRVTVGAAVEGDWLVITVDDTGIGIAPSHFAKLGDPFFQARSSYDRMFEGTGLGLSLVRGLVGLHGGSLLLESVVEQGTRIAVRLPLDCRGKAPCDPAPAPIETVAALTRPSPASLARAASSPTPWRANKEKKIA
jgi:two-component system, cell cycle sensor histidine kinase DivJ